MIDEAKIARLVHYFMQHQDRQPKVENCQCDVDYCCKEHAKQQEESRQYALMKEKIKS